MTKEGLVGVEVGEQGRVCRWILKTLGNTMWKPTIVEASQNIITYTCVSHVHTYTCVCVRAVGLWCMHVYIEV